MPTRLALLVALTLLGACAARAPKADLESASEFVAAAETAMTAGEWKLALDRLVAVQAVPGIPPELRNRVTVLTNQALDARIRQLEGTPDAADELHDLFKADLPRRLRGPAAVALARAQLARGDRLDAFRTIRELDEKDPEHLVRSECAQLVFEIGMSLAADTGKYFLGMRTWRYRAPAVLEYLVLRYPSHPDCDLAYLTTAQIYEDDREWSLAISRYSELFLYHRESEFATESELRIPELRLAQIVRDDHDRGSLVEARRELEAWLARHPDDERVERAQLALLDAHRRLALSDLAIARFYADTDNPYGAWQHAERAQVEARQAGDQELVQVVAELLDSLPPREEVFAGVPLTIPPIAPDIEHEPVDGP